jgi:hypothetical protein
MQSTLLRPYPDIISREWVGVELQFDSIALFQASSDEALATWMCHMTGSAMLPIALAPHALPRLPVTCENVASSEIRAVSGAPDCTEFVGESTNAPPVPWQGLSPRTSCAVRLR